MLSKRELIKAIENCENAPESYQNCEKLATFYTLYDHYYGESPQYSGAPEVEKIIQTDDKSDFGRAIDGKPSEKVWPIMSELLETVKAISPRLYDGVITKLNDL